MNITMYHLGNLDQGRIQELIKGGDNHLSKT